MKAAAVHSFSHPPRYADVTDPVPAPGEVVVTMSAAALSPLVRAQAAGKHYTSGKTFPFVPGVDGVGTAADGTRVYFAFPRPPSGAMAQRVAVASKWTVPLPTGVDDVTAAAIANPGMSGWAALKSRARLRPGEVVLVNGATGSAGGLAVRIAKHLGARRVIATGRDVTKLDELRAAGADVTIPLADPTDALRQAFADGVDVVVDYLWGPPAGAVIAAATAGRGSRRGEPRVRFVQVGSSAGDGLPLAASALRSSGLELLGSGIGSLSVDELIAVIGELLAAAGPAGLTVPVESVLLADVETAWTRDTGDRRLVFTA